MKDIDGYLVREEITDEGLWKKSKPVLLGLDIELTERCNNKCIHCYINQEEDNKQVREKEMSTQRVKEIVSEAASLGCMTIRYTGGEPLLRKDFIEIYLYTRRCGINVALFTNATLLSQDLIAVFDKYPPGEPLEITIYGIDQDHYESISKVKGSFESAMRGIKLLVDNDIPFHVNIIRTPGADNSFTELEQFALKNSFNSNPPGISMNFNLRARRDNKKKNSQIKKLRSTPEETLTILTRHKKMYMDDSKAFVANFMGPRGEQIFNCGCGRGGTVDSYGVFQPCMLMRHPDVVYDLKNGSIKSAIKTFFPEIRKTKAESSEYKKRCANCFLYGFCDQCPAYSWMEYGSLDMPVDYLCEVTHAQAIHLGLLKENEKGWEVKDWKKRINEFIAD